MAKLGVVTLLSFSCHRPLLSVGWPSANGNQGGGCAVVSEASVAAAAATGKPRHSWEFYRI
jgi:hypothetical protein